MDTILLITVVILTIAVIALIIIITIQQFNLINPSKCPLSKGNYGLQAGTKIVNSNGVLATLNTCGISGDLECVSQALTLAAATEYCISNFRVCDVFSYSNGVVSILDPKGSIINDNNYDLYFRQYPIN